MMSTNKYSIFSNEEKRFFRTYSVVHFNYTLPFKRLTKIVFDNTALERWATYEIQDDQLYRIERCL